MISLCLNSSQNIIDIDDQIYNSNMSSRLSRPGNLSSTIPLQFSDMKEIRPTTAYNSAINSPPIARRKPPFVSTTKSVEVFGDPPPKPPRLTESAPIESQQMSSDNNQDIIVSRSIDHTDNILVSHLPIFQRLSIRWLNLSSVLFSLCVVDSQRHFIDKQAFHNFVQVMKWRATGNINEDEFTALYTEWMGRNSNKNNNNKRKQGSIGLFTLRQVLLENECQQESEMDLFIGMIVNELNRQILGSPIAFSSAPGRNLEISSKRWISLSEDLFFALDSPGYGFLSFDEVFSFVACLTIGLDQMSSSSVEEQADDLSVGMLAASALQLMKDSGVHVIISTSNKSINISANSSSLTRRDSSPMTPSKTDISLPMFKYLLVKKGVNEHALALLIDHVKTCIERLVRLTRQVGDDEIYHSCHPLESRDSLGSPRLWQYACLNSVGYESMEELQAATALSSQHHIPPIILYLLTDADRCIHGSLRASEEAISTKKSSAMNDVHETAYRMWTAFQTWGGNAHRHVYDVPGESHRDPSYQLIVSVIVKYKSFQQLLCARLPQLAQMHRKLGGQRLEELNVVCVNFLPNIESILVELGFDEEPKQVAPAPAEKTDDQLEERSSEHQWTTLFDYREEEKVSLPIASPPPPPPPPLVEVTESSNPRQRNSPSSVEKKQLKSSTVSNSVVNRLLDELVATNDPERKMEIKSALKVLHEYQQPPSQPTPIARPSRRNTSIPASTGRAIRRGSSPAIRQRLEPSPSVVEMRRPVSFDSKEDIISSPVHESQLQESRNQGELESEAIRASTPPPSTLPVSPDEEIASPAAATVAEQVATSPAASRGAVDDASIHLSELSVASTGPNSVC